MARQLSAPPAEVRHFGDWVARSRWWPEGAVVRIDPEGMVRAVAAPPLVVSAPSPAAGKLPAVVTLRYLQRPVRELLAEDSATVEGVTPAAVRAATVAMVELVVDTEVGPKGEVAVCRQLTIRPPDIAGRWTNTFPARLVDPETGAVLRSGDGGYVSGLGRLPVEEVLTRYLRFWSAERGLKPRRRARVFTAATLSTVAEVALANPTRPVRAVAEHFDWRTPDAVLDRFKAQRAVSRAIAEGKLSANAPGLRRGSPKAGS